MSNNLLDVHDLRVSFGTDKGEAKVLDGVNLEIGHGQIVGLVGESGCGKTTLARSILGTLPKGSAKIGAGTILFNDEDLLAKDARDLALSVCGRTITFIPQDPFSSFNPVFTIGTQIQELMKWKSPDLPKNGAGNWHYYSRARKKTDYARVLELLRQVQLPDPELILKKYPHEVSGGQRQRLMIAMALLPEPKLIIADEPTTALDVTIQAQILKLLRQLVTERGISVLFTTHDLGTTYEICDRVTVMYAGQDVESATNEVFFANPGHPYTNNLLESLPKQGQEIQGIAGEIPTMVNAPSGCRFHPRCTLATDQCIETRPPVSDLGDKHIVRCYHPIIQTDKNQTHSKTAAKEERVSVTANEENTDPILQVHGLKKYFDINNAWGKKIGSLKALDDVSFDVRRGEILGIVGESGCGKSTLGKTIMGIHPASNGRIIFEGDDITDLAPDVARSNRKHLQYAYQDPGASLDPRWKIGRSLHEPLQVHSNINKEEREQQVLDILKAVGLPESHLDLYPHEISGGQQRRVGLARILTLRPSVIILDEPTSGLDVSVQATILNLFLDLRQQFNLTYLFISHDLSVVNMVCNRVAVMYLGKVVEFGEANAIFSNPKHPYTQSLLSAAPTIGGKRVTENFSLSGEPPNPSNLPSGCRFCSRCPIAEPRCSQSEPLLEAVAPEQSIACFVNR